MKTFICETCQLINEDKADSTVPEWYGLVCRGCGHVNKVSPVQKAEAVKIIQDTWEEISSDALAAYGLMTRENIQDYAADFKSLEAAKIEIHSWKNTKQFENFWSDLDASHRQEILDAAISEGWSV